MTLKTLFIMVAGFPRAGKSRFADEVYKALGYPHIPLDRYIMPPPPEKSFLEWVKFPTCIDWTLVSSHLLALAQNNDIQVPRGVRFNGLPKVDPGPIIPGGKTGYVIPGTHAFSFPDPGIWQIRVFVKTSDQILASRLSGRPIDSDEVSRVIRNALGENLAPLAKDELDADLVIDGNASSTEQISLLTSLTPKDKKLGEVVNSK